MFKFIWLGIFSFGLILRLYYMLTPVTKLSFDEAVYAVEAMNILQKGERPVFFYNQPYTGALQAYISAFFYSIFGIHEIWIKSVPFLVSLLFMVTNYLLAKKIFASSKVGLITLTLTAVTTPFWVNWTTRAGSNYSEMMVLGNLSFLLALKLLWDKNSKKLESAWYFFLGLAAGVGFWIQPTIVYYLIPITIVLLFKKPKAFITPQTYLAIPGFILGSLPVIIWNLSQNGNTFRSVINVPDGVKQAWIDFFTLGVPVLLGVRGPSSTIDFFTPLAFLVYLIYAGAFLYLANMRLRKFITNKEVQKEDLLLLFSFIVPFVWSLTPPFNLFVIEPRYVSPLYTAFPIVVGYFIYQLFRGNFKAGKYLSIIALIVLLTSNFYGYLRKPPSSFLGQYRVDKVLSYLKENGYKYVWANFDYSYRLIFESKGEIIASAYNSLAMQARYPEYTHQVKNASKEQQAYVLTPSDPVATGGCQEDLSKQDFPCKRVEIDNLFVIYSWR